LKFEKKGDFMKIDQLRIMVAVTVALLLAAAAGSAIAGNQNEMNMGKKSHIELTRAAKVGDVTLPPGEYVFQHVVSAGQHVARFTGPQGSKKVIEVKCTNEPLKQKASQTFAQVEKVNGADKLTRIEIAGEDVAHVF
jgi:hypothetical protein